jgi:hypothetical protein
MHAVAVGMHARVRACVTHLPPKVCHALLRTIEVFHQDVHFALPASQLLLVPSLRLEQRALAALVLVTQGLRSDRVV